VSTPLLDSKVQIFAAKRSLDNIGDAEKKQSLEKLAELHKEKVGFALFIIFQLKCNYWFWFKIYFCLLH